MYKIVPSEYMLRDLIYFEKDNKEFLKYRDQWENPTLVIYNYIKETPTILFKDLLSGVTSEDLNKIDIICFYTFISNKFNDFVGTVYFEPVSALVYFNNS